MADIAAYTPNVVVITGAAQGIGRTIALRLADDGFNVAVADLASKRDNLDSLVEEIASKGRKAIAVPTDVTLEQDVQFLIQRTVRELGGVDVMIANAGVARMSTFLEMPTDDYELIMNVNVKGVMLCYKYAAIQMVTQKRGGRIIGASSALGKQGMGKFVAAYSTSKFAIRGLTQALSNEMAPYKITVNAYAPGVILTDFSVDPVRDPGAGNGTPGSFTKQVLQVAPDTPDAPPDVVASFVSYICKPEAYFVTGQAISMCGGSTLS